MADIEFELERDIERAARFYKLGDTKRWAAAYYAAKVVGRKPVVYGATRALADRMGKSVDAVEDLAHAWFLYEELRSYPQYRRRVCQIMKMPYIYYSYFRYLYEARDSYHLTLSQVMSTLEDMVQAGGKLHQEDLETIFVTGTATRATGPISERRHKKKSARRSSSPIFPRMCAMFLPRPSINLEKQHEKHTWISWTPVHDRDSVRGFIRNCVRLEPAERIRLPEPQKVEISHEILVVSAILSGVLFILPVGVIVIFVLWKALNGEIKKSLEIVSFSLTTKELGEYYERHPEEKERIKGEISAYYTKSN